MRLYFLRAIRSFLEAIINVKSLSSWMEHAFYTCPKRGTVLWTNLIVLLPDKPMASAKGFRHTAATCLPISGQLNEMIQQVCCILQHGGAGKEAIILRRVYHFLARGSIRVEYAATTCCYAYHSSITNLPV